MIQALCMVGGAITGATLFLSAMVIVWRLKDVQWPWK